MFNDSMLEIEELRSKLVAAQQEIQRLKAGGCARDQVTTQFCAEAVEIARDRDRLREALKRIEGPIPGYLRIGALEDPIWVVRRIARDALDAKP
jgi:uncharacterized small protein (DUF1192 family)